ncbi:ketoacyl-ACP synthase III [bacterium]|nr:ketoacyl-ACP synthase III [bacterium]MCG2676845.1 ketoacyl-ACP synthase III [bacterium]
MRSAKIVGVGSYAPPRVLTNQDLARMVDTSDKWIMERTGIRERHIADDKTAASDIGLEAARRALKDARVKPEELDLIIVATITADMSFPSTACLIQDRLGAKKAAAFDLEAACSGFIYALSVARGLIASGEYDTILVVASEVLSKITDWEDRDTCVLFGDGAGAVVLKPAKKGQGILSTYLRADGGNWNLLWLPAGGSRIPTTRDSVDKRLHYMKMEGNRVFKIAVKSMTAAAIEGLKKAEVRVEDISLLITHQANLRIINAVAKRLSLPPEKVFINLDRYGNTSAASIPLALDEAAKRGRIKRGDLVILVAFGGGFTWASAVIRWERISLKSYLARFGHRLSSLATRRKRKY